MNAFVLDLWHDLKQKRLWPVAAAMLAAIAAVPILLSKPVVDPGEAAPAPAADRGRAAQIPLVDLEAIPASSNLDTFSAQNPFIPNKDMPKPAASTSGSSGGSSGGSAASAGAGSGSGAGSGDSDSGGSTTGGSSDTGSGSGSGGGDQYFSFEVDLKFGPVGEEKKLEDVQALDVLPDEQNPVVVFMGVKDDGKTALFMVLDPGLEASGEGKCEPSKDECGFFELTTKDTKDEMLLDSSRGQDYGVQLTKVTRVNIDEPAAQPDKAEGARSPRKKKDDAEPFFLPRLIQRAMGVEAP